MPRYTCLCLQTGAEPVDFAPFLFAQFSEPTFPKARVLSFASFNRAVDEHFSRQDTQRTAKATAEAKSAAQQKLERMQQAQQQRLQVRLSVWCIMCGGGLV